MLPRENKDEIRDGKKQYLTHARLAATGCQHRLNRLICIRLSSLWRFPRASTPLVWHHHEPLRPRARAANKRRLARYAYGTARIGNPESGSKERRDRIVNFTSELRVVL